jgi:hypothetical protein
MKRANDKADNDNDSGTSSTKGGGAAPRDAGRFLSFSGTVWSVLANPRRNVGFFLVMAVMTFCFYMTSYSSSSSEGQGGGGLQKTSSSSSSSQLLRHGMNHIPGSVSGTAQDPCTIWLAPSSLKGNPGVRK